MVCHCLNSEAVIVMMLLIIGIAGVLLALFWKR